VNHLSRLNAPPSLYYIQNIPFTSSIHTLGGAVTVTAEPASDQAFVLINRGPYDGTLIIASFHAINLAMIKNGVTVTA
jgi:hypothetical protein